MTEKYNSNRKIIAQSATELAVFGGILIFLIGGIVRVGLSTSLTMNAQLKTLRLALTESYRSSEGEYSGVGNEKYSNDANARNVATVLVVEDRLAVSAGAKYGSIDRMPYYSQASATMSKNLYNSMDYKDNADIPILDVFVNGQRFPFSIAGFKEIRIANDDGVTKPDWIPVCPNKTVPPNPSPYGLCWEPNCRGANKGCTLMFSVVGNYPASENWCSSDCSKNLPVNLRFDLNFDGVYDDVPTGKREKFFWQWYMVAGVTDAVTSNASWIFPIPAGRPIKGINTAKSVNVSVDADGDYYEEALLEKSVYQTEITEGEGNTVKVDTNLITVLQAYDFQEGDLNNSQDARSMGEWRRMAFVRTGSCGVIPDEACNVTTPPAQRNGTFSGDCYRWACLKRQAGLQDDVQMYSLTSPRIAGHGAEPRTYLRLEEGKLLNPRDGTFVRSTTRHDHVDIIERRFKLSNDTHRFCDEAGHVTDWSQPPWVHGLAGLTNPVEACNLCYDSDKIEKTCMDQPNLTILIRSRIEDLRRRRWIRRYAP